MAQRPVYIPTGEKQLYVKTESVDFTWFAGMSVKQKQRSVDSLHEAAKSILPNLARFSKFQVNHMMILALH